MWDVPPRKILPFPTPGHQCAQCTQINPVNPSNHWELRHGRRDMQHVAQMRASGNTHPQPPTPASASPSHPASPRDHSEAFGAYGAERFALLRQDSFGGFWTQAWQVWQAWLGMPWYAGYTAYAVYAVDRAYIAKRTLTAATEVCKLLKLLLPASISYIASLVQFLPRFFPALTDTNRVNGSKLSVNGIGHWVNGKPLYPLLRSFCRSRRSLSAAKPGLCYTPP